MNQFLVVDMVIAYVLDLIFGDPYWMPHPVRFIGLLISKTEKLLRKFISSFKKSETAEFISGIILLALVAGISFLFVFTISEIAKQINPILFHIINIYFIYSALTTKCLADEAKKVYSVLMNKDIVKSRKQLAMLVGRQTDQLNEEEIIRGVVETTAENTVDGVVSPLIYAFVGSIFGLGAPAVYIFKAVSTLDSMVGYMNEKYILFGRASARFDDFLNYIPARITGLLIPVSAMLLRMDYIRSFKTVIRDRKNHKSPNCAYPEAAAAGALGVQLGGINIYFGKKVEKPTIGDPVKRLEFEDILSTIKLLYMTSFIIFALGIVVIIGVLY